MNNATEALVKLAEELTARVSVLECENQSLRKKASVAKPGAGAVVSEQVVDATINALVKSGSLTVEQISESRKTLLADVEAPHRVLQKVLDAYGQVKKASVDDPYGLSGGRLAGIAETQPDPQADCLDRMAALLRM